MSGSDTSGASINSVSKDRSTHPPLHGLYEGICTQRRWIPSARPHLTSVTIGAGIMPTAQTNIRIVGGGPAGSAAAIAACRDGADVGLLEKSRAPRHKICGEFISAEACRILDKLGAWPD